MKMVENQKSDIENKRGKGENLMPNKKSVEDTNTKNKNGLNGFVEKKVLDKEQSEHIKGNYFRRTLTKFQFELSQSKAMFYLYLYVTAQTSLEKTLFYL